MISRGEVALIVATKGMTLGLMSQQFFGPVIITVVATTIIAPILLKVAFRNGKGHEELELTAEVEKLAGPKSEFSAYERDIPESHKK